MYRLFFILEVILIIRESLYFSFAGRRSTDFGIYNVSLSNGLYEEQISSNKSINEVHVRGNLKPYFIDTKRDPKQFQLRFSFLETWNDELIDEVVRWLNVDYYEPLFFSANMDRVFYAMPIDSIDLIHNGLKQGYMNLTIRCDSAYSYSQEITSPWYECHGKKMIELENRGHLSISPVITFKKIEDGDLTINNLTNKNQEFKFKNLKDSEIIYVDCQNEIIETSIPNMYRFDDFNENYLTLIYGLNNLKISGKAMVNFRYRFIYL